jgi:hypothetical protein
MFIELAFRIMQKKSTEIVHIKAVGEINPVVYISCLRGICT